MRYYNSSTGRFLSEDPIGFASYDINFYQYASNNPLNKTDPSGLWNKDYYTAVKIASALAAGVALGILANKARASEIEYYYENVYSYNTCGSPDVRRIKKFRVNQKARNKRKYYEQKIQELNLYIKELESILFNPGEGGFFDLDLRRSA